VSGLGSSSEARYAVENLAPLDGFVIATWGITWPNLSPDLLCWRYPREVGYR